MLIILWYNLQIKSVFVLLHTTWVFIKLGVQVLVFGVELVVDTVHRSHQGKGSHGCSDEQTHFAIVFVHMGICCERKKCVL